MNPKSNTLFHFTKSRETLKHILRSGFWPQYSLEDVAWFGSDKHEYVAYPMVCFCDIPLSRIGDHVKFYGEFGIGLIRPWAEAHGLNPVFYVAGKNVLSAFRELNDHSNKHVEESQRGAARVPMRYLLAHTKPAHGKMMVVGQEEEKSFFQESEWRYVPKHNDIKAFLVRSEFNNETQRNYANTQTKKHCLIKFEPKDIRYIFVKSDADIPDVVKCIQTELDLSSEDDRWILISRVVSLESLSADL